MIFNLPASENTRSSEMIKKGKKLSILFSLLVLPLVALAEFEVSNDAEWRTVEYGQIDFEAVYDDGGVFMEWSDFPGSGLEWYKVIKSVSNDNPVYPDADMIGVKGEGENSFFDAHAKMNAYYRVCAITSDKGRSCSNVVWVEVQDDRETDQKIIYTDHKTEAMEKREKMAALKNAHIAKKEKRKETRNDRLYEKLEGWLEKVENRLENSDLTSAKKIERIKKIQARLYEWEKGNDTRMAVVDFLDKTFMAWIEAWEAEADIDDIGGFLDGLLDD